MNLASEKKDGATIIHLNEEKIDIGNSIEFRSELSKHAETDSEMIILDMEKVTFIDSSGIGVLITFFHFSIDSNKVLKLANCQEKVIETMKTTKLDSKIPMFDSIDAAMN